MTELNEYRSRLIARYASQPGELVQVVEAIRDDHIVRELEPGGWSPHQILSHIRDVEAQAFVPRIRVILEEESPRLQSFDPSEWMDEHYDADEGVREILDEIRSLRSKGSDLIQPLNPQVWSRTGEHPSFGVRTLQWWVEYSVRHFEEHIEQLAETREA